MSLVAFDTLPDDARVWIFAAAEPLAETQAQPMLEQVRTFVERWAAHGRPVAGGYDWRDDRFLLVGADERASQVSGCSIDSLFHTLQQVERAEGIAITDRTPVWYRSAEGEIEAVTRPAFRRLVKDGSVHASTAVFDNTVATAGAIRRGEWERPLRDSWHAAVFGLPAAAA